MPGVGVSTVLAVLQARKTHPDETQKQLAERVEVIARQVLLKVLAYHCVQEIAVADPVDLHRDGRRIHRHQRDALLPGAREHIGLAGKVYERLAVADVDVELGGLRQGFLHRRRQASPSPLAWISPTTSAGTGLP